MKKLCSVLSLVVLSFSMYGQIEQVDDKTLDSLRTVLDTIFIKDQTFRRIYTQAEEVLGANTYEMEYFWEVVEAKDKIFEQQVAEIIDKYGWLGISQVGRRGNTTLWLVVQHGSVVSKKKYAELLKESVLKNESQAQHYVRLIDRMLINSNEAQLYGSQIDYESNEEPVFFEIKEPEFVDQRRSALGLPSLQEFAEQNGIKWDFPQKERKQKQE